MNLVQFRDPDGGRKLGVVEGASLRVLPEWPSTYELARAAIARAQSLVALVGASTSGERLNFGRILAERRVLAPLEHPDPAHCLVSGTGLTHLGSAQARNAMHAQPAANEQLTDSMRLFRLGLAGGKPADGTPPVQPEWFYKGDGSFVVAPEQALEIPAFAADGGEEAELVGLYVIADDGTPFRVGFALGNEFSDHVMERENYLCLSHSKLRTCSLGPEVWIAPLPASIEGRVSLVRGGTERWSAPFLSGEDHMSYRFAGLEHHHFKYRQFRRPGDVHLHFFGAATLSFSAGIRVEAGDSFEIAAPPFTRPLRNPVNLAGGAPGPVRTL